MKNIRLIAIITTAVCGFYFTSVAQTTTQSSDQSKQSSTQSQSNVPSTQSQQDEEISLNSSPTIEKSSQGYKIQVWVMPEENGSTSTEFDNRYDSKNINNNDAIKGNTGTSGTDMKSTDYNKSDKIGTDYNKSGTDYNKSGTDHNKSSWDKNQSSTGTTSGTMRSTTGSTGVSGSGNAAGSGTGVSGSGNVSGTGTGVSGSVGTSGTSGTSSGTIRSSSTTGTTGSGVSGSVGTTNPSGTTGSSGTTSTVGTSGTSGTNSQFDRTQSTTGSTTQKSSTADNQGTDISRDDWRAQSNQTGQATSMNEDKSKVFVKVIDEKTGKEINPKDIEMKVTTPSKKSFTTDLREKKDHHMAELALTEDGTYNIQATIHTDDDKSVVIPFTYDNDMSNQSSMDQSRDIDSDLK
ncbi:MAG TPA: hypothetical protein VK212_09405 [Lentimicrobium sp.]|nr:hypothetical protein [Lentimicrobium sp.]